MIEDFLLRAALGGIGTALVAGPVGAFMIWRRMAYFGEALANAALLGVALALLAGVPMLWGVLALVLGLALLLARLEQQRRLPLDALLGLLAHGALAFGLIALGLMEGVRVDLMSLLLGDVLAVDRQDLLVILVLMLVVGTILLAAWRPLLAATAQPEIAAAEGVPVPAMRLLITLMIAAVIAVGMKVVGILLVVALLVMPAAAARRLARTPEQMALLAALLGVAAVIAGLLLSLRLDLPAGPAIAAMAAVSFLLASLLPAGLWSDEGRQEGRP